MARAILILAALLASCGGEVYCPELTTDLHGISGAPHPCVMESWR